MGLTPEIQPQVFELCWWVGFSCKRILFLFQPKVLKILLKKKKKSFLAIHHVRSAILSKVKKSRRPDFTGHHSAAPQPRPKSHTSPDLATGPEHHLPSKPAAATACLLGAQPACWYNKPVPWLSVSAIWDITSHGPRAAFSTHGWRVFSCRTSESRHLATCSSFPP